jgi:hypothetical protein
MALVDELRRARFRGAGRMAFLAQREEISQALAAGASKKAVWQLLHDKGQMPIGYARFVAYTHRYIEAGELPEVAKPAPEVAKGVSKHEVSKHLSPPEVAKGEGGGTPEATPSERPGVKPKRQAPKGGKPKQFRYPGKASDKDELV